MSTSLYNQLQATSQSRPNTNQVMQILSKNNPQVSQIMNMINSSGMSAKQLFMTQAKQLGQDPNKILEMLK